MKCTICDIASWTKACRVLWKMKRCLYTYLSNNFTTRTWKSAWQLQTAKVHFIFLIIKKKFSHNKSWRLRGKMECWASVHLTQLGQHSCQLYMPAALYPQIPWYSFLLEAEWTPWLNNAEKENRSLENFQGTYWDSQNLPSCGAVPQPTGPPLALSSLRKSNFFTSKSYVTALQQ